MKNLIYKPEENEWQKHWTCPRAWKIILKPYLNFRPQILWPVPRTLQNVLISREDPSPVCLKKLAAQELINYEPYGYVTLTSAGEKVAKEIEKRHILLKDFLFRFIGVDEKTADETACRMEHSMDKATFKKFKTFVEELDNSLQKTKE